jgi:hypothetical protein
MVKKLNAGRKSLTNILAFLKTGEKELKLRMIMAGILMMSSNS